MAKFEDPKKIYIREQLTCRAEIEGRTFQFVARVEDVDTRGILAGEPDLAGRSLAMGQEVLVRYFRQDSAYQFMSRVLGFDEQKKLRLVRLAFPSRITRFQRRKWERQEVTGTVKFQSAHLKDDITRGFIIDLSAGGMKFSTARAGMFNAARSPVGEHLVLEINTSSGHSFAGINAEIRRVTDDPRIARNVAVQVVFSRIHPKVRAQINKVVENGI
ncbi:hypothetical protein GF324_14145 [bacterium]|nr:hypothetical protein [bacterium]